VASAVHPILLIAADWRARALTLAQLQEAGYEVEAVPGVRDAARALLSGSVEPGLLLLDTRDDADATPEKVAGLLELAPQAPAIVITGAYEQATWEPLRPRLAALLHRPISIARVVEAVQRVVPAAAERVSMTGEDGPPRDAAGGGDA
jgi:DNA-binding NtrC family response regulator